MTSEARIQANRINAQSSTGPRSQEAKARVSQNSVTLGLFTSRDLIRPEEKTEYEELRAALEAELLPATVMERTLAMEILHATWRLRRCALTEAGLDSADASEAIDRARAHARNNLRRATAELSRLQTERHLRAQLKADTPETLVSHQSLTKSLAEDTRYRLNQRKLEDLDTFESILNQAGTRGYQPRPSEAIQPEGHAHPSSTDEPGKCARQARSSNSPEITKQTQSTQESQPEEHAKESAPSTPTDPRAQSSPDNAEPHDSSRPQESHRSHRSHSAPPAHRNASS
jgi:hypothetical protein